MEDEKKTEEVEIVEAKVKILTKDEIFNVQDVVSELVEVPEWGGSVWVYGLTAKERDAFEETMITTGKGRNTKRNLANLRARLCARCIRNENGKRIFKGEDIEKLGEKSGKAINRVFEVAQRLSGMTDDDVEELVGN